MGTSPFDDARWATNWNVQAAVTPLAPISTCPTRSTTGEPKLLGGQRLRYQGHLPEFSKRPSRRNRTTELHSVARIHERRSRAFQNVEHAVERKALATGSVGWVQRRQLAEVWSGRRQLNGHRGSSRPGAPRLESSDQLVQLHRNPGFTRVMQVGARYSF
jgi:hypothetical protein